MYQLPNDLLENLDNRCYQKGSPGSSAGFYLCVAVRRIRTNEKTYHVCIRDKTRGD